MDSREAELSRVGRRVRDALDAEAARGEDVRLGRARFVEHVTTRNLQPPARRGLPLGGAGRRIGMGVLALGAATAATLFWVRRPISFQIDDGESPGAVVRMRTCVLVTSGTASTESFFKPRAAAAATRSHTTSTTPRRRTLKETSAARLIATPRS